MTGDPATDVEPDGALDEAPDGAPARTRDWVWGLVVVLAAVVLVTAALVWVLVGSSSCGTQPAPGYERSGSDCRSFSGPRPIAGPMPGHIVVDYVEAPAPVPPYRRST